MPNGCFKVSCCHRPKWDSIKLFIICIKLFIFSVNCVSSSFFIALTAAAISSHGLLLCTADCFSLVPGRSPQIFTKFSSLLECESDTYRACCRDYSQIWWLGYFLGNAVSITNWTMCCYHKLDLNTCSMKFMITPCGEFTLGFKYWPEELALFQGSYPIKWN